MRVMRKRGGAGEEYWEYSMTQASLISDVTHHCWGAADDNMTPHERKTGRPPSVSHFCPMFRLAYASQMHCRDVSCSRAQTSASTSVPRQTSPASSLRCWRDRARASSLPPHSLKKVCWLLEAPAATCLVAAIGMHCIYTALFYTAVALDGSQGTAHGRCPA
eukprot:5217088-Pleurochrysis_carterae.AAC.1